MLFSLLLDAIAVVVASRHSMTVAKVADLNLLTIRDSVSRLVSDRATLSLGSKGSRMIAGTVEIDSVVGSFDRSMVRPIAMAFWPKGNDAK